MQPGVESLAHKIPQTQKGPNADTAHSRFSGAIRSFETVAVVTLFPIRMKVSIEFRIVGLLIQGEPIHSGINDLGVTICIHGVDLNTDGAEQRLNALDRLYQILVVCEFGRFSGEEKNVAETVIVDDACFLLDLIHAQGCARNLIACIEAAVLAPVAALIGEIHRGVEVDVVAEALA